MSWHLRGQVIAWDGPCCCTGRDPRLCWIVFWWMTTAQLYIEGLPLRPLLCRTTQRWGWIGWRKWKCSSYPCLSISLFQELEETMGSLLASYDHLMVNLRFVAIFDLITDISLFQLAWCPLANLVQLRDPRSDSWPLMSSIWPTTFICIAYVYIVKVGKRSKAKHFTWHFKVAGPNFMKNREPYNIKGIMIAYNLFQVTFTFLNSFSNIIFFMIFG